MNILFVSGYDAEGARFNGLDLHRSLRRMGIGSDMAVMRKRLDEPGVHPVCSPGMAGINRYFEALEERLGLYSILPPACLPLYFTPHYRRADVVHLQLPHVTRFFSLFNAPLMSRRKKLIWTLHEPWLTTGHCHHPMDCGQWLSGCKNCPDLERPFALRRDRSALNWRLKRLVMRLSRPTLVAASNWMRERAEQSPILAGSPCRVIPFGLDQKIFRPLDKQACRKELGLPTGGRVLAFRWVHEGSNYKGCEYIEKALLGLEPGQENITLLTFDQTGGTESLRSRYQVRELGWVKECGEMARVLSAADIFLAPSIAETFGMTAVEAMACGTVPVVFDQTALPEVTKTPDIGMSAPQGDHQALGRAVRSLLDRPDELARRARQGRELVERRYRIEDYVKAHVDLYRELTQE